MKRFKGFTLIELLIVVAIIAILAAIAVPNFLEAQVRSKVSRAKNDERALATALESYYVDFNAYPPNFGTLRTVAEPSGSLIYNMIPLSTPISYITNSYLIDPFGNNDSEFFVEDLGGGGRSIYFYLNSSESDPAAYGIIAVLAFGSPGEEDLRDRAFARRWVISSAGPDRLFEQQIWAVTLGDTQAFRQITEDFVQNLGIYDPTNGTTSRGDINRSSKNIMEGSAIQ